MIKIADLRIGNQVRYNNSNYWYVHKINQNGKITIKNDIGNKIKTNIDNIEGAEIYHYDLSWFNFYQLDKYTWVKNGVFVHQRKTGYNNKKSIPLKFIHQLQNLYYTLKQKEI